MKAAVEGQIRATWQGGAVTVLKSGYLLKKGSGLRKEWARRFFELDSAGMLDYRSSKVGPRSLASHCCHHQGVKDARPSAQIASKHLPRLFARLLKDLSDTSRTDHTYAVILKLLALGRLAPAHGACITVLWFGQRLCCGVQDKRDKAKTVANKVALQTATVKAGPEEAADAALQFCFRVVSQSRSYVLQAEDDLTASEWIETIQVHRGGIFRGFPLTRIGCRSTLSL